MAIMNTSIEQRTTIERVDELMRQSDEIYEYIDTIVDDEPRHRRLTRLGINTVAIALRKGKSYSEAGAEFLAVSADTRQAAGPLDFLGNQYADVERATLDLQGKPETDSRHAMHLTYLSVPYAEEYYSELDTGKIAFYDLIHDLVEAEAKDVSSLGITKEQAKIKHQNEMRAIKTLRQKYGKEWPGLIDAIECYEGLDDIEARYTKTFDKLDPGFTHFSNKGFQLIERYNLTYETFLQTIGQSTLRMATYSGEFPQLLRDREELHRRVAEVTFKKAA